MTGKFGLRLKELEQAATHIREGKTRSPAAPDASAPSDQIAFPRGRMIKAITIPETSMVAPTPGKRKTPDDDNPLNAVIKKRREVRVFQNPQYLSFVFILVFRRAAKDMVQTN